MNLLKAETKLHGGDCNHSQSSGMCTSQEEIKAHHLSLLRFSEGQRFSHLGALSSALGQFSFLSHPLLEQRESFTGLKD